LCSDSESFGLAIAEAMAVGTPVVVTHTCPWREVETEGAGLWVPQTAAAIARAIDRLLAHRESARAMGERARALVQRKYTWSCAARLIIDCYERMIAPRRRLARVR
jgi:glycosyltransferase involved in cell wall biosynthesis